jgi:hypothetical protein
MHSINRLAVKIYCSCVYCAKTSRNFYDLTIIPVLRCPTSLLWNCNVCVCVFLFKVVCNMALTPARGALRVLNVVDVQSHRSTTNRRSVFKALPEHNRKYRRSLSLNDENRLCFVGKADTCQSERQYSFKVKQRH